MVNYVHIIDAVLIMQIFVLINPLSSLPVLIEANKQKMNCHRISIYAVCLAFGIALLMSFIGPSLLKVFGITLEAFRIAGGVVLLMLGIQTVFPKEEVKKNIKKIDAMVSIIATPLLTGPATISFVVIKSNELGRMPLVFNLLIAFILVGIIFYVFSLLINKVNMTIVSITSRVLGLFLAAVATQMIIRGITGFLTQIPWPFK